MASALAGDDPLSAQAVECGVGGSTSWRPAPSACSSGWGFAPSGPRFPIDATWGALLTAVTVVALIGSGVVLYRRTRFS